MTKETYVAMRLTRQSVAGLGATAATVGLALTLGMSPATAQTAGPSVSGPPIISTVVGTGHSGHSGDGGPGTAARVAMPTGVAEDVAGNLYIADTMSHKIRKLTPAGIISTVAGSGTAGFSGDGGPATSARIWSPESPAVDGSGNLYFADSGNNRIRRVSAAGIINTVAGTGVCGSKGDGGPATAAQLCGPSAVAVDSLGNLYIADSNNNKIRKVTSGGVISTFAGTGKFGKTGDGGPAVDARLALPTGVAVDTLHNVFIADSSNNKIRKVDPAGVITRFAGTGSVGFDGDGGPAGLAKLNHPSGIGLDSLGNVYIADSFNFRIRVVIPKGDIFTYAGSGIAGYKGDGGPALNARINVVSGDLAVDANNVFFTDTLNNRVRRVTGGPPPNIPESVLAALLPLSAVGVLAGGVYVVLRRRRRSGVAAE